MHVIEVDPASDARWERYVTGHPQGLIYHRAAWQRVLARDYGDHFVNLLCEDGEDVVGVLPLCRTRGLFLRLGGVAGEARLASLPRSPICGPLASHHEAVSALALAASERSRAAGVRLQLRPLPDAAQGLDCVLQRVAGDTSYVLELPQDGAELRFGSSRNHGAIRRAVAKAGKLGVEVRAAQDEGDLRAWYPLYLEAMRHHVAPPRPYRFFRDMWDVLKPAGMMELLLAEQHSQRPRRLLAGCLFLMSGQTVVFGFNGRREEELGARPNDALHWHAIHEAQRRGFRRYDFGEVHDGNVGLAQFKLKWGADPRRLYRYYEPRLEHGVSNAADRAGYVVGIASAGWRRVPLRMTARIGSLLYRYV